MIPLSAMVRVGFLLNVLLVPIVVDLLMLLGPWIFDIHTGVVPAWAR